MQVSTQSPRAPHDWGLRDRPGAVTLDFHFEDHQCQVSGTSREESTCRTAPIQNAAGMAERMPLTGVRVVVGTAESMHRTVGVTTVPTMVANTPQTVPV